MRVSGECLSQAGGGVIVSLLSAATIAKTYNKLRRESIIGLDYAVI